MLIHGWDPQGDPREILTDSEGRVQTSETGGGAAASEGWSESANADNALATATHAGVAGQQHVLTHISASFSASVSGALLTIKEGAVEVLRFYVYDSLEVDLELPFADGADVVAELAASGTVGVIGAVNISGYSI